MRKYIDSPIAFIKRRLLLQTAVTLAICGALLPWFNYLMTLSFLFGGGIAMLTTALLLWYARRAENQSDAGFSLRLIYRCAFERLFLVIALFALAMGILHLNPLTVISGFATAQLTYILTGSK